jgi:hypothetical protein
MRGMMDYYAHATGTSAIPPRDPGRHLCHLQFASQ